jgi:hypothetical protein
MPRGEHLRGRRTPGSGRKKGTKNKVRHEARDAARRILEDPAYVASLQARAQAGQLGPMEPVLWHYAHGKPKDTVHHEGDTALVVRFGGRYRPDDDTIDE